MPSKKLTYKSSGVDIYKAAGFIKNVSHLAQKTLSPGAIGTIGGFGGLFELPIGEYKNPVLVSSTDGVGTKLKIANLLDKHDTVGIDLVAMNVNDILCCGAKPLFFLDYIACGGLDTDIMTEVVKGITAGCRQAGCALIGGETAQMPGMYRGGDYDLAGFCVGVVEKDRIIDGRNIEVGDSVIGIESNGLHSNGFSLVRKVFSDSEIRKYANELLKPTRIYVKPILSLLSILHSPFSAVKGISHITGGAFYNKLARILPKDEAIEIKKNSWPVPKIFNIIQKKGRITDIEMFSTFNMGIGMALVVDRNATANIISKLSRHSLKSWLIGEVIKGKKEVIIK